MNNVAGTSPVPLTVFGGAVTEMAPEDLPEGASPFSQDSDFVPGAVFTRGGRQSVYSFNGLFAEDLAGFAVSIPGLYAPNEAVWSAPNNVTLNLPGTYATAALNISTGSFGAFGTFDKQISATGSGAGPATSSGAPTLPAEVAILLSICGSNATIGTPDPSWTVFSPSPDGGETTLCAKALTSVATVTSSQTLGASSNWLTMLMFFSAKAPGINVAIVQEKTIVSGGITPNTYTGTFGAPITVGNGILVTVAAGVTSTHLLSSCACSDNLGSVYTQIGTILNSGGVDSGSLNTPTAVVFWCPNPAGLNPSVSVTTVAANLSGAIELREVSGIAAASGSLPYSQILQATNFGFSIPVGEAVLGAEVELFGHQGTQPVDAIVTATLVQPSGTPGTTQLSAQLPLADAEIVIGTPMQSWGVPLTPAMVNNPSFGVQIVASATGGEVQTFSIYAVKLKVFTSPSPPANFDWIKSYEQTSGQVDTLALDANGVLWDENVTSAPGVLNGIYTGILPNTFGKSVTFDDIEYIALSNLINGTDIPRQWNGTNLDRVSQYGPGAPPAFGTTSAGANVLSITQVAATTLLTGAHDFLLVSAGPSAQGSFGSPATPGNVLTINVRAAFVPPTTGTPPVPVFAVGTNVVISGFPIMNGNNPNNDPTGVARPAFYTITSAGSTVAGQLSYDWITLQLPFSTFYNAPTSAGCSIQSTQATLTASQQVPFLQVGNQLTLSGVTPSGWDNTFTVTGTPNASQMTITQTLLTGNVATYVFTLITGVAPVVGEFVTVTGTLNGGGIFNVVNAVISAASPTSFSVNLPGPNVAASAEVNSNATVSGTIFQFDPAGIVTNPIIGNATAGGTITTSGVIGVGIRMGVVIFETRNNALTAPSPPATFNVTITASGIVATSIPIGPPDTIKRILAFTGAGGANFFYIPNPVTVVSNGANVTYSSTVINDNTTTQVTLSFPDAVLLNSTAIDIPGNNLFEQEELGSCRGFITYASRLIAWGEQNKISNLLNLSFDGGVGVLSAQQQQTIPGVTTYPLGWTVDPVNGGGGSLLVSPVFGNSYYVKNATGVSQALYGMIEQNAFQDAYMVPIIFPAVTYSARITARCPGGSVTGSIVVDLFSPSKNQQYGSFTIPLASLTTNMQIITGTLLTTPFSVVPNDLLLRIYGTNIANLGDFEIDRMEPFPTLQPSYSTQLRASYANNQEAFDLITGAFGPNQNQQPINGVAELFDLLYALKERSCYSTSDNGVTEPNQWNWREVSNKIGTIGQNSYDYGEGWMLTACRQGAYFFEGGEPIKVSQEIQSVWDLINWQYGPTIWLRNDEQLKRITIGVPIPTPNPFMPEFPVNANPTQPNVILMCSYRELNTGAELAHTGPIRSTFSGRLMSPEPARKWSFWNIACPYADFIDRANNQWPEFFCTGYANSKIYQLSSAELDDDGNAINSFYVTYGFVKPEMADAKGLGLFRMELDYLTMLLTGTGSALVQVYPESVQNPLPYQLGPVPLQAFSQGDCEVAVNITGNRFFIRVGSNAVGNAWRLSKVVAALTKDAWSEVRGSQVGSA
jgi:hypothetical protein